MEKEWTEQQLLVGLNKGDEAAYRFLFDLYYQVLVTFAYRYMGDLDSSRNLVQDVFVMLFDKRKDIHIHTSLKSHLFQSVKNRALNAIKREKMQRDHHHRLAEEQGGGEIQDSTVGVNELTGILAGIIDQLPDQCKRIFRMSRQDGIPNAEIADKLSISKRTVETQISKALKIIRADLIKTGYLPAFVFDLVLLSFFI